MLFYVIGMDATAIKEFFSVLPEDQRPKIVSDKEYPSVWEHPSDDPVVIATEEPRLDVEAKELNLTDRQVDDVLKELHPDEEVKSDDVTVVPEGSDEEEKKIEGPRTYADRGFRVGKLI